jgi:hypothetical protein
LINLPASSVNKAARPPEPIAAALWKYIWLGGAAGATDSAPAAVQRIRPGRARARPSSVAMSIQAVPPRDGTCSLGVSSQPLVVEPLAVNSRERAATPILHSLQQPRPLPGGLARGACCCRRNSQRAPFGRQLASYATANGPGHLGDEAWRAPLVEQGPDGGVATETPSRYSTDLGRCAPRSDPGLSRDVGPAGPVEHRAPTHCDHSRHHHDADRLPFMVPPGRRPTVLPPWLNGLLGVSPGGGVSSPRRGPEQALPLPPSQPRRAIPLKRLAERSSARATSGSFGSILRRADGPWDRARRGAAYRVQLAVDLPHDVSGGLAMLILPRSTRARVRADPPERAGLVDADYAGPIGILVHNLRDSG